MVQKRILIADDEKAFAEMLKLNLQATGEYEVRIENDPSQVLPAALQFQPDLILLDIIMPKVEGPDIAFKIKSHESLKKVPIIFLTAAVKKDEVDSEDGMIGGYPFVAKTSSLNVLIDTIEKAILSHPYR